MDGWMDELLEGNGSLHHEEGKHQGRSCYSANAQYLRNEKIILVM